MKFLSDILAKAGLTVDGVVTLNNTATGQTPATNDNSTKLATTAFIKNQSYLSANQTITVSGDATGSGTTSIILTLANSGVTAGVYGNASNIPTITVDAKGRITSISTNAVSIVTTLAGLSDVTLTSPSANQVLQYNGTQWVNGAAPTTYSLPIATSSILGGIKVGTGLSIDPATGILTTSGGAGGNLNFRIIQEFTATAGQTTFTISGGYNVGYVEVLINGVYISENQYTATNGTTIVLNDASTAGDIVTVFLYSLYNLGTSVYARNVDTLTATAGQTSFSTSYIVGQIDVYYNGSKLTAAEYTATTGSSIVLVQAAVSGDIIEVVTYLAGAGINASRTLTINGTTYDLTANRTWTLTTANISEVTNLYYTDARVATYLTTNSYATESYVGTQLANLVASAPSTLDTLNELATALGNDANFATTITTSIGTKQAQLNGTGFVKISGTTISYDNSIYLTSITSGNVTTALGYTPYNSTNPSGYISSYTETDTLASVTGRGASTSTALTLSGGITVTGLTIAKSAGISTITFPAGTNDPAFISHTESTANVGIMRFSVGDDNDTIDYFAFGNTNVPDAFRINANGTISIGIWQGTAIADTYISSAATWNAKQAGLSGTGFVKITGTTISYDNSTYYLASNPSGYISSYTETDTLSSVVARGSSTTSAISAANFQVAAQVLNLDTVKTPGLYHYDGAYTGTQPIQNWYNVRTIEIGNSTRASQFVMPYNVDRIFYRRNTDPGWQGYVELYHTGNLPTIPTNNNQLTNGAGYITGITSGNVTTALGFTPYNATNPSGYITSSATSLSLTGNLTVSSGNTTGGGIILADDGDIVDLNDAYLSLRFSSGVRVFSANRGGSAVITLANTGAITATGNVTGANLSGTNTGDQTTITGNAGSATLLKSINTTTSALSNWNPQSLTYQAWGQAWTHSSIGGDSGDMVLWLRAGQYSAGGTEVCMIIDGDYYAANGAQKVLHAGNYGSYSLPLSGGSMTGQITWSSGVAPISFQQGGNSGTYTQTTIYANQNNTSGSDANGIFIERGYTDTSNTELRRFIIGSRGGGVQWRLDGPGNVTQTGGLTATYLTTSGEGNFGPDSGGNNGIRIRYGNVNGGYGMVRFMQDGTNHSTIHSFSASWQGGSFIGASAGSINIDGQYGATFGGWNVPYAHINSDGIYVKAWATPSGSTGWNANSVLRLQQGSTGNDVYIEMRNRADVGDHAAILFTDNNVGGYIGFRTYASNNVAAGSDCMIYGTYNDHIFQNGSSGVFNGKTETFRIYANGSVRATGDVTAYSDRRVKENIITIDKALEKTLQLRGVFYNRTDKDDKSQKVGVIAQEIQEILPQVVNEDYNGLLSVSYGNITGLLIEAVKELKAENDALKEILKRNNII